MRLTSPLLTLSFLISIFAVILLGGRVYASTVFSCPSGLGAAGTTVEGQTCYAYFASGISWSAAKSACAAITNGQLAVIRNNVVNDVIFAMTHGNDVWIGSADNSSLITGSSEGNFSWVGDSSPFWQGGVSGHSIDGAYTNWQIGEPNDFGSNEDCVELYNDYGKWNDYPCANGRYYVCQMPAVEGAGSSSSSSDASTVGGGVRNATLQSRIQSAMKGRGSHGAAPVVRSSSSSPSGTATIAATCARMRYATASPATQKKINEDMKKKYGQTCR